MLNEKVATPELDGPQSGIVRKAPRRDLAEGEAAFERFFQADVADRLCEFQTLLAYCASKQR